MEFETAFSTKRAPRVRKSPDVRRKAIRAMVRQLVRGRSLGNAALLLVPIAWSAMFVFYIYR